MEKSWSEKVALNILITPEQKAALEETARRLEISVSAWVRKLINQHYNNQPVSYKINPRRKK